MTIRCVLKVAITSAALLAASACAVASGAPQTIYLDPDTGDVIQHPAPPAPGAESSQKAGTPASQTEKKNNGYTRWTTRNGTKMLAVDPGRAPREQVVRCADGSLRMGGRAGDSGQGAKNQADSCRQPMH